MVPECEECGLVFLKWEDFQAHMKQMHAYERTRETL